MRFDGSQLLLLNSSCPGTILTVLNKVDDDSGLSIVNQNHMNFRIFLFTEIKISDEFIQMMYDFCRKDI